MIFSSETDVSIACLTCYGALISLSLPSEVSSSSGKPSSAHSEMEAWLTKDSADGWPWIVDHCVEFIRGEGILLRFIFLPIFSCIFPIATNQSLVMEAIQVLTAVVKFYFPVIRWAWSQMQQIYLLFLQAQVEGTC